MAYSVGDAWRPFIEQWRDEFRQEDSPLPMNVFSETTFRTQLEHLCRLHVYFLPDLVKDFHFATIGAVAYIIDQNFGYAPPLSLSALIFGTCFASVQHVASQGSVSITTFAQMLGQLNGTIAPVYVQIEKFIEDADLQKIVQETINIFMDVNITICRLKFGPTAFCKPSTNLTETASIPEELTVVLASYRIRNIKSKTDESVSRVKLLGTEFELMLSYRLRTLSSVQNSSTTVQHFYDSQTRFSFVRFLGRGSFGDVHEVRETSTNELYAKKIIHLSNTGDESETLEQAARAEFETMKKLTHVHIIRVILSQKEPDKFTILMLPVADSNLQAFLQQCTTEEYPLKALSNMTEWFGCLLHALAFAHRCKVIHQDIKPSNILIKAEGSGLQVYLADFGVARDFSDRSASVTMNQQVCGTLVYRAPELRPGELRGRAADIFSLGCVFSEMFTIWLRKPLKDYREFRRARDKEDNQYAFRENLSSVGIWLYDLADTREAETDDLRDRLLRLLRIRDVSVSRLIRRMMSEEPEERPVATQAIQELKHVDWPEDLFCQHCFDS